jgi:ubiquinone/menaquinone biosynthesis C-methylase UbiE
MNFDLLAPHYRWMEIVLAGEKLQHCRTAFLPQIRDAKNVLILGEGNGRFLLECRKALISAQITCVDSSPRMLQLARSRLERRGLAVDGIQFVQADALSWKSPTQSFDLIVTHFFLDCFAPDQLQQLLAKLACACLPRSRWLLADFQIPEAGIRRWRAGLIHWMMYCFFRIAARLPAKHLTVPDPILRSHGFILQRRMLTDWDLLRSDLWERA